MSNEKLVILGSRYFWNKKWWKQANNGRNNGGKSARIRKSYRTH